MCREVQGLAVTSAYLPHCRARGQRLSVGGEGQLCSNSPGIPGREEEKGSMFWVKARMISVAWPNGRLFQRAWAHYVHALAMMLTLFRQVHLVVSASLCCLRPLENSQGKLTDHSSQTKTFQTRFTQTFFFNMSIQILDLHSTRETKKFKHHVWTADRIRTVLDSRETLQAEIVRNTIKIVFISFFRRVRDSNLKTETFCFFRKFVSNLFVTATLQENPAVPKWFKTCTDKLDFWQYWIS